MLDAVPDGERIAALESKVDDMRATLHEVRDEVRSLTGRSIAIGTGLSLLRWIGITVLAAGGYLLAWKSFLTGGVAH